MKKKKENALMKIVEIIINHPGEILQSKLFKEKIPGNIKLSAY